MGGALLFITDNGFIYQTGLPGWAIALIILGSILLLALLALVILFVFFPVYYVDKNKNIVIRAIYIRTKDDKVTIISIYCKKLRLPEPEVYEKKADALKALNK